MGRNKNARKNLKEEEFKIEELDSEHLPAKARLPPSVLLISPFKARQQYSVFYILAFLTYSYHFSSSTLAPLETD